MNRPRAAISALNPLTRGFSRARASADVAEIRIYDAIGKDWFGDGISAKEVADALEAVQGCKQLNVYINSPGGDVFEAAAIHAQLKRFAATKTMYIDGVAASGASVIAMAGDRVVMPRTSMLMIHHAWMIAVGTAADLRKTADDLDVIERALYTAYLDKTGMAEADLKALLDTGDFWMTAEQAKERKFCDEVLDTEETEDDAAAKAAHPLLAKFKGTPRKLMEKSTAPSLQLARMGTKVQKLLNRRQTKPA